MENSIQTIWPVHYIDEVPLREALPVIGYRVQRSIGTCEVTRIEPNGLCFGINIENREADRIPEPINIGITSSLSRPRRR